MQDEATQGSEPLAVKNERRTLDARIWGLREDNRCLYDSLVTICACHNAVPGWRMKTRMLVWTRCGGLAGFGVRNFCMAIIEIGVASSHSSALSQDRICYESTSHRRAWGHGTPPGRQPSFWWEMRISHSA